jgi:serine phosphatase RsbU (regulator of sigma subunit)
MGLAHGLPWQEVFAGLDDIIAQAGSGAFVTGLLGQLDLRRGEVLLASAGHLPPSIVVNGRPMPVPPDCQTRPWGLDFESPWKVGRLALGQHWSILCFTDGVADAAARPERGSGAQVLADYHECNHHLAAEDLCQGLLSEVCARGATTSLVDDQTVLVLRSR